MNVEKSPFLVERLQIWCMPSIVLIKDGKTDHTIQGFDELGGDVCPGWTLSPNPTNGWPTPWSMNPLAQ